MQLGHHLNKKLLPQSSQFLDSRVLWFGTRFSGGGALQLLAQVLNDGFNTYGGVQSFFYPLPFSLPPSLSLSPSLPPSPPLTPSLPLSLLPLSLSIPPSPLHFFHFSNQIPLLLSCR